MLTPSSVCHMYVSGLCVLPQALGEPFAYETYRQQRIEAKLDAQREGRISLVRKLPKVMMHAAAQRLQRPAMLTAAKANPHSPF